VSPIVSIHSFTTSNITYSIEWISGNLYSEWFNNDDANWQYEWRKHNGFSTTILRTEELADGTIGGLGDVTWQSLSSSSSSVSSSSSSRSSSSSSRSSSSRSSSSSSRSSSSSSSSSKSSSSSSESSSSSSLSSSSESSSSSSSSSTSSSSSSSSSYPTPTKHLIVLGTWDNGVAEARQALLVHDGFSKTVARWEILPRFGFTYQYSDWMNGCEPVPGWSSTWGDTSADGWFADGVHSLSNSWFMLNQYDGDDLQAYNYGAKVMSTNSYNSYTKGSCIHNGVNCEIFNRAFTNDASGNMIAWRCFKEYFELTPGYPDGHDFVTYTKYDDEDPGITDSFTPDGDPIDYNEGGPLIYAGGDWYAGYQDGAIEKISKRTSWGKNTNSEITLDWLTDICMDHDGNLIIFDKRYYNSYYAVYKYTGFSTTLSECFHTAVTDLPASLQGDFDFQSGKAVLWYSSSSISSSSQSSSVSSSSSSSGPNTVRMIMANYEDVYVMKGYSNVEVEHIDMSAIWEYSEIRDIDVTADGDLLAAFAKYNVSARLHRFDGISNTSISNFTYRVGAEHNSHIYGVAWDGTDLYTVERVYGKAYQHDGFSNTRLDSFYVDDYFSAHALCWVDGDLGYISNWDNDGYYWQYQGFSSTIRYCWVDVSDEFVSIAYDPFINDRVWSVTQGAGECKFLEHNTNSSTVTDSFTNTGYAGNYGLTCQSISISSSSSRSSSSSSRSSSSSSRSSSSSSRSSSSSSSRSSSSSSSSKSSSSSASSFSESSSSKSSSSSSRSSSSESSQSVSSSSQSSSSSSQSSSSSSISSSSTSSFSASSSSSLLYNANLVLYDQDDIVPNALSFEIVPRAGYEAEFVLTLWNNRGLSEGAVAEDVRISVACSNGLFSGQSVYYGQECVTEQWVSARSNGAGGGQSIIDDSQTIFSDIGGDFGVGANYLAIGDIPYNCWRTLYFRIDVPTTAESTGIIRPLLAVQYDLGTP